MAISFEGKVEIVTGAGGGLGRAYALELAKRGAKVVVNDLGGARDGTGHSDAALKVVEEIAAMGGTAMSNGGNVAEAEQMAEMVAKAKEAWGGVHILINNAGILRDKSFAKMEIADFELVVRVHLLGSAICTKAVWETMREQNYGRILMTASSTGLFGNFGQTNYGAAKLGLAGFTKSLYLGQHACADRGDADDRGYPAARSLQGVRSRQCRARRALSRFGGCPVQRHRRRRRRLFPHRQRHADAGRRVAGR